MKVALFDHNGSDRHVAAYFWESTHDDDSDAFTCPDSEIERILRFGLKAQPVPHGSPFGHPSITLHVTDVPLFVAHQWQRHRVQNFSEKSHRYVDATPRYYVPDSGDMRGQYGRPGAYRFDALSPDAVAGARVEMQIAGEEAFSSYLRLLDLGVAREVARTVLPVGMLTRFYATASLRNWLNFLVQRNDEHAQLEIRRCAEQVESILATLYPITLRLWGENGRRIV